MADNKNIFMKKRAKLEGAGSGESRLFGEGFTLDIQHVPTGYEVSFSAFVDNFSDAYNSEWSAEQVYGRMDPIPTFQNTRRALALSWIVPSFSIDEAKQNLDEVNKLLSFLYPLYSDPVTSGGDGNTKLITGGSNIVQGPLVRVKFGNLIQDAATGGGLLGYLNGFTMDPDFELGMFMIGRDARQKPLGTADVEYLPKAIKLNFELNVLHEHSLGWIKTADGYALRGGRKGFPYGTNSPVPVAESAPQVTVAGTEQSKAATKKALKKD
jgi:hypothetical protein